jgi:hypothetical protein
MPACAERRQPEGEGHPLFLPPAAAHVLLNANWPFLPAESEHNRVGTLECAVFYRVRGVVDSLVYF